MRFQTANLVKLDFPIRQHWSDNELRERLVVDRLDLGNDEGERFANFREQILNLANAREILIVGVVFRELKRSEVKEMFEFQIECLLEFQAFREIFCRRTELPLPLFDSRISLLDPAKILLPFADVTEQMGQ